jgi:hypothetical protein
MLKSHVFTITLRHRDGTIYCQATRLGVRSAAQRLRELATDYLNIYGHPPKTRLERCKP